MTKQSWLPWLLLLPILAVGVWWLAQEKTGLQPTEPSTLFWPAFEDQIASLQKIEVLSNQGKHRVTLIRHPEYGFVVQERDWPANMVDVRHLLHDLSRTKVVGSRGSDSRYHAELGVANAKTTPSTKVIRFYTAQGLLRGVVMGEPREQDQQFVRFEDDATVRVIDRVFALVPDPGAWIESELFRLSPEAISKAEVRSVDGSSLTVVKNIQADSDFSLHGVPNNELTSEQKQQVTNLGYWLAKLSIRDVWTGKAASLPVGKAAIIDVGLSDGSRVVAEMYPLQGKRWVAFDVQPNEASDAEWLDALHAFKQRVDGRLFELTGERGDAFDVSSSSTQRKSTNPSPLN